MGNYKSLVNALLCGWLENPVEKAVVNNRYIDHRLLAFQGKEVRSTPLVVAIMNTDVESISSGMDNNKRMTGND